MRDDWQPTASFDNLRERARILAGIRAFFVERGVLEVETPCLSEAGTADLHIESFATRYTGPGAAGGRRLFLHTSPEFPMKRLLAAGSGPIYQLARVFRNGEAGRNHNPEFTLLEWYRPGFSLDALMEEVAELVMAALGRVVPVRKITYADAFLQRLELDPHRADREGLTRAAAQAGIAEVSGLGRDDWLNLLLTHLIEPSFSPDELTFLYDYPASQAALARIRPGEPPVAERFELYFGGVELANGFHELADAAEQGRRFATDQERRLSASRQCVPTDARLLAALAAGLPDCCGVALGIDRLLMAALGAESIAEVVAFPIDRA